MDATVDVGLSQEDAFELRCAEVDGLPGWDEVSGNVGSPFMIRRGLQTVIVREMWTHYLPDARRLSDEATKDLLRLAGNRAEVIRLSLGRMREREQKQGRIEGTSLGNSLCCSARPWGNADSL